MEPRDDWRQRWLEEAKNAPLPASSDSTPESTRQQHISALAKAIRNAPAERAQVQRRLAWTRLVSAAAAVALIGGGVSWLAISDLSETSTMASMADHPALEAPQKTVTPGKSKAATNSADPVGARVPQSARASLRQVVGNVVVTHDDRDVLPKPGETLIAGDRVSTTAEAFASFEFEGGARVDLSSATTVELSKIEKNLELLKLRTGRVDVNVPELPSELKQHLEVVTPDARVVVRGTIFSVEVDGELPPPGNNNTRVGVTRVSVTRGVVAVYHGDHEHTVPSGEHWSSDMPHGSPVDARELHHDETTRSATSGASKNRAVRHSRSRLNRASNKNEIAAQAKPNEPIATETPSSLAKQNRLFERGLRARDQGDDQRAAYWFSQLLQRFPGSPLSESAQRERDAARGRMHRH